MHRSALRNVRRQERRLSLGSKARNSAEKGGAIGAKSSIILPAVMAPNSHMELNPPIFRINSSYSAHRSVVISPPENRPLATERQQSSALLLHNFRGAMGKCGGAPGRKSHPGRSQARSGVPVNNSLISLKIWRNLQERSVGRGETTVAAGPAQPVSPQETVCFPNNFCFV